VQWKDVVSGAFILKELLEKLELKSFVKLTGGKGLHVHIPVAPIYNQEQLKAFAKTLALEMVSQNPKNFTANISKQARNGKIFLDYLRNGPGATSVAPYSLRARPLSTIALPIEWSELKRIKGPQAFTMKNGLRKIKQRKSDPWKGMQGLKQKISLLK
jgi:bifunctional non-homologous end joining protein LigD